MSDLINKKKLSSSSILDKIPVEYMQKEAIISEEEVSNHHKIKIIEESGSLLPEPELNINAKGLISKDKKQNGIVLFGDDSKNKEGERINDIILKLDNVKYKEPTIFTVYYRIDQEKYYFKMIETSNDFFCFSSIVSTLKIFSGLVVSVLNFNFKFTIMDNNHLSIDYELDKGKIINKTLNPIELKRYLIGRKSENDIYINDSGVSRTHFSIYFKEKLWFLVDGDGDKKSASGTWHYIQEPVLIEDNMKVKIRDSTLGFKIYNQ